VYPVILQRYGLFPSIPIPLPGDGVAGADEKLEHRPHGGHFIHRHKTIFTEGMRRVHDCALVLVELAPAKPLELIADGRVNGLVIAEAKTPDWRCKTQCDRLFFDFH